MKKSNDQKLIDLMFALVLVATDDPIFCKKPRGERMAWVANNLRERGFDTHPIGMSWGVLVDEEYRKSIEVNSTDLDL